MEFLQGETVVGDFIPSTTSYCLFRALNCIEQKLKEKGDIEDDDDETQLWEF